MILIIILDYNNINSINNFFILINYSLDVKFNRNKEDKFDVLAYRAGKITESLKKDVIKRETEKIDNN